MNFLLQAFQEPGGNPSSMRVMTFIVVAAIMTGWLSVTLHNYAMAPLDINGPGGIVLGALGVKAWQRGKEGQSPTGDTQFIPKPNP